MRQAKDYNSMKFFLFENETFYVQNTNITLVVQFEKQQMRRITNEVLKI